MAQRLMEGTSGGSKLPNTPYRSRLTMAIKNANSIINPNVAKTFTKDEAIAAEKQAMKNFMFSTPDNRQDALRELQNAYNNYVRASTPQPMLRSVPKPTLPSSRGTPLVETDNAPIQQPAVQPLPTQLASAKQTPQQQTTAQPVSADSNSASVSTSVSSQAPTNVTAPSTNDMSAGAVNTIGTVFDGLQELMATVGQQSNEGLAAIVQGTNSMLAYLDQLQAELLNQIKSQMRPDDPALLSAIGLIKDAVAQQRNQMLEEMNARGLSQSGILLEMNDRVNRGELTQIQQLVSSRVADLQNQLNSALMNIANMRMDVMQNGLTAQSNWRNTTLDRLSQLGTAQANAGMQYAQMQQGAYQSGLDRVQQMNIANMDDATKRYGIDMGMKQAQMDDATKRYSIDMSMKQAQMDDTTKRYLAQTSASAASSPSPEQMYAAASDTVDRIVANYNAGMGEFTTRQQIIDYINNGYFPDYIKAAVLPKVMGLSPTRPGSALNSTNVNANNLPKTPSSSFSARDYYLYMNR